MAFDRPTLSEIDSRIQADFKTRIDGATSLLRRSILKIQARVYAGACHLIYGYLQYEKDQLFITSADTDNLETHGSEYGVARKQPTKATGEAAVTGTTGKIIPAGTELISNNDTSYFVDDEVILASGAGTVSFTAEDYGEDSNNDGGIELYFVSPIAGVDSIATVATDGISGGLDEEDDEDYRARILTRKRRAPHGGAYFDYENWALEVPGVTRAWAIPEYYGVGTIGMAFVRDDDSSIIPSTDEMDEVRNYLVEHTDPLTGLTVGIPVGAEPGLIMIPLQAESLNFIVMVSPNNSTVQSEIEEKLSDLLLIKGGPGETLYLSDIDAAISSSATELAHKTIYPTDDIGTASNRVPILGTVTLQDYS
jgi:uncharacterized phage protein gp47/JayE